MNPTDDPAIPPEEGQLVESGSFRVDAERMLETLSRYQLRHPEQFLHAMIRCAVASGAGEARIERFPGEAAGLLFIFDGEPFTREQLSDIYSPLLSGEHGRGGHLAAAVLALLNTRPALLDIASGGVSVPILGKPPAGPASYGRRTVLRVLWEKEPEALPLGRILDFPAASDAALACCPIPVRSPSGESRPFRLPSGPLAAGTSPFLYFNVNGRRGFLSPVLDDGSAPMTGFVPKADSTVNLHLYGVYAETHTMRMPLAPVIADLDDDALTLDASFGKFVRNERFADALAFLESRAELLLKLELKRQEQDLAEIGRMLKDRSYRQLWRARMGYLEDWKAAAVSGGPGLLSAMWKWLTESGAYDTFRDYLPAAGTGGLDRIQRTGPRTWWLQDACRRALKGRREEPKEPALRALWKAPVLLSSAGKVLSLADIMPGRLAGGRLRVFKYFAGDDARGTDGVWPASFRDREFLKEFVPEDRWLGD